MSRDRRETPANARVAHVSLRGLVEAPRFVEGELMRAARPVAALRRDPRPDAPRERQLVLHEGFRVLEAANGWAFGLAERDGFTGFVALEDLGADTGPMTHVVAARQSYLSPEPRLKSPAEVEPVSFGTQLRVRVTHEGGRWSEVERFLPGGGSLAAHVPSAHLRPIDAPEPDAVAVAERFLGTPYLWGGNSGFGIDCSGLVQAAMLACGIACPGDSDQQAARLGTPLPPGTPPQRGDLLFWPGHVALCRDESSIIHATAAFMQVVIEAREAALARIEAAGEGPLLAHRRPPRPAPGAGGAR